ncbi:hypothetical protein L486_03547 [Kwoniella mangroviensis CBS 10435]|uniref:Protein kinase domain-containing protein n=1 Tax=Kwoniella mangroviensis CBS 10435 TaxID=1331196 RepID=A0A1B9IU28_9TREE|nr:hypothetical protein L486_03547 [Kwoniella mangroviensis CBS 10435]
MNPTELMETVSEESPFQTWQLTDPNPVASFSASKPLSSMQTVKVTKLVTSGYLWDYWLAEHSQYGSVILKLVYIPNYACDEPNTWEHIAPDQVLNEALKEEKFYLGPLSDLQGQVVPRYYGLYHTVPDDYHYAILLEYADVSGPVTHDLDWREKLYKAYDNLHLRGVWHGNLSSRHILTDSHNQIRLVGFRRALKLDLTNEDDVEKLMVEALEVREHIGLEVREEVKMSILSPLYYAKLNEHDRKHLVDSFPLRSHHPMPEPLTGYAKMIFELFPSSAIERGEVRFEDVYPSQWISRPPSPV